MSFEEIFYNILRTFIGEASSHVLNWSHFINMLSNPTVGPDGLPFSFNVYIHKRRYFRLCPHYQEITGPWWSISSFSPTHWEMLHVSLLKHIRVIIWWNASRELDHPYWMKTILRELRQLFKIIFWRWTATLWVNN